MTKRTFTDRMIKALKPAPAGQRRDQWDGVVRGLGIRSSDKGNHVYVLSARFPGGKNPTRRTIADVGAISLPEARDRARRWLELIGRGIDPAIEVERQRLAEQRKHADTFASVAEAFFASHKFKAQRRGHVVERIARRELLPHWGGLPVTDISHRELRVLLLRVVDRGAARYAHNVYDAANAILNFAAAHDQIEINPCRLLKRNAILPTKKDRQRVLNDTELRAFWSATGQLDYPFGPFFRLLLLTGVRLNELLGARWREFDREAKTWTIPAERFKSNSQHIVPLSDDALQVLATLPQFTSGDFLFTTEFGRKPISSGGVGGAKYRLDRHMRDALGELVPFVSHDLRRTLRTRLSALVPEHVAELVIGHARKGISRVYDAHKYHDEKREALAKLAMLLRSIIDPPPANVVPLRA